MVYFKHGLTKNPHYKRHRQMMQRCYNPKCRAYANYGGRGIKVFEKWHDIANFIADLPEGYVDGLELDRIDNNGNYEPGNVRWATRKTNCGNRRTRRLLTYEGHSQSVNEWAEEKNFPKGMLKTRIDYLGWSVERALTEPVADKLENMIRAQSMRWIGHTKRPRPTPRVLKRFPFQGQDRTIAEISSLTGISINLLRKRICERHWSVEKATQTQGK